MRMKFLMVYGAFLVLAVTGKGCSCEPEELLPITTEKLERAHGPEPDTGPPPQPAPEVAGRSNALIPPDFPLSFTALGVRIKIHYTQISARLVQRHYHFQIEAKTRGRLKGEKATLQVPPYIRCNWQVKQEDMDKIAGLAGKTFSADCVILLKSDQWASGSSVTVSIDEVTDTSVTGKLDGTFRFASGAFQGRTFRVTEGNFRALISREFPAGLR